MSEATSTVAWESGMLYGSVEAGGTKFVCGVGTGPDDLETVSFPTTTPDETLGRTIDFFRERQSRNGVALVAIGIGSFGPVDLDRSSATYGHITTTPKAAWPHTDLAGAIGRALGVPVGFDTDVNAAALGEHRWGAAQGLDTFIYLTLGTGVGGGGMVNGALMHGLVHPEMGHIRIPHDLEADPFPGVCPYHGDCLEGLACGPALMARWQERPESLPQNHPAWPMQARYLAYALVNFICTLSPQRIIMGGGTMQQAQLFPLIRREVRQLLSGYVQVKQIVDDRSIEGYIVPPGLGGRAGVLGGIALAQMAAK
jgi:fructokinase